MKRIILISLILLFAWIPISLEVHTDSVDFVLLEAIADAHDIDDSAPTATPTVSTVEYEIDENGIKREVCSSTGILCGMTNALNGVMENIALLPIFISSFFVFIAGTLLNISILETVIRFGEHFNAVGGIPAAWGTLRDLANIFFIFALLTIAISTILGLQGYGYKQLLANLIIVALIINFSLFFTKFVIDTSNIFALQFYKGISVEESAPGINHPGDTGIANTFMKHLGVTNLWETDEVLKNLNRLNYSPSGGFGLMFLYSIFVSIFFMITAFVFIFAAIMLITRGVGFILLAILSPLAFAALILPKTRGIANQWWGKLWEYAIFAPALLILFWVITTIMPSITATFVSDPNAALLGSFSPDPQKRSGSISMILNFLILITLMLSSIIISNKLSIAGGKQATKLAGKATFGALGVGGRNTFGRAFSKLSQSEGLKEAAAGSGMAGFGARLALRTTRAGAAASYDIRGAPGVAEGVKGLKIDIGKPQKGGYEDTLKKQVEDRTKFAGSLAPSAIAQEEKKVSLKNEQEILEGSKEQRKVARKAVVDAEAKRNTLITRHNLAKKAHGDKSFEALSYEKDVQESKTEVNKANVRMVEEDKRVKEAQAKINKLDSIDKEKRAAKYAGTLASEKTLGTLFRKVPRKNKEAAIKIKSGKSDNDKLTEILEKRYAKKKDKEDKEKSEVPAGPEEKEEEKKE